MHSQINFMHFSGTFYAFLMHYIHTAYNIVQPRKDALLAAEKYAIFSETYRYIQQKQNFTL